MADKTPQTENGRSGLWIIVLAVGVLAIVGVASAFALRCVACAGPVLLAVGMIFAGISTAALLLLVWFAWMYRRDIEHITSHAERIETVLESHSGELRALRQLTAMSEQAKSLIYHEREVDALSEMVHAMLLRQDYDGAEALIQRAEQQLGLAEEAQRLREAITSTRQKTLDEKIDAAIGRIDEILSNQDWPRARREVERMVKLFPDHEKIRSLPQHVRAAWNAYKTKLLRDYGEAVRVNDVEHSISLLKELDRYLTPQEGAALSESARDVFKKKLHNLGVQFAIAVADQQWAAALATGEEIMNEYPNSRMAHEVREKMPVLREYASGSRQPPTSIIDLPDLPGPDESTG